MRKGLISIYSFIAENCRLQDFHSMGGDEDEKIGEVRETKNLEVYRYKQTQLRNYIGKRLLYLRARDRFNDLLKYAICCGPARKLRR
jgi:hypothetical protein